MHVGFHTMQQVSSPRRDTDIRFSVAPLPPYLGLRSVSNANLNLGPIFATIIYLDTYRWTMKVSY